MLVVLAMEVHASVMDGVAAWPVALNCTAAFWEAVWAIAPIMLAEKRRVRRDRRIGVWSGWFVSARLFYPLSSFRGDEHHMSAAPAKRTRFFSRAITSAPKLEEWVHTSKGAKANNGAVSRASDGVLSRSVGHDPPLGTQMSRSVGRMTFSTNPLVGSSNASHGLKVSSLILDNGPDHGRSPTIVCVHTKLPLPP